MFNYLSSYFNMKLFNLLFVVLAVLALMGGSSASPKGIGGAIRKGGKVIVSIHLFIFDRSTIKKVLEKI